MKSSLTRNLGVVSLFAFGLFCTTAAVGQIVWVTQNANLDDPLDDSPNQAAIDAGVLVAPDKDYTDLLSDFAPVERFFTRDELGPDELAYLNDSDLIIISRGVNSPAYQSDTETAFWNTQVTTPVIMMSGYITRDSRLNFFDGGTMVDTTGPEKLEAIQPNHPVFAGVALDGDNVMTQNFTDGLITVDPVGEQRGISINNNNVVGGEVIAQISADGSQPGGPMIAEWAEGAVLNNGQELAGRRMIFLSGSREAGGVPIPAGAGAWDLTAVGQQMFLNAVDYLFPILGAPGDVDGDEDADQDDFNIISGNFGQNPAAKADGDLNFSGEVDLPDFRRWKNGAFPSESAGAAAAIPEPTTIGLALLAGTLLACRASKLQQRNC